MITGHKDADTYLMRSMDDRTLMKTLLSLENKELLGKGEDIFKERLRDNYPYLYEKKPFLETYRNYYLKMIYYIGKLKEEFNIDYIPVPSFNPEGVYRGFRLDREYPIDYHVYDLKNNELLSYYAELGDERKIKELATDNFLKSQALYTLISHKNISLYEKLLKEWEPLDLSTGYLFSSAIRSGDKGIIESFNKIPMNEEEEETGRKYYALLGAAESGDIEMLEYINKLFPEKLSNLAFEEAIGIAAKYGNIEFIKKILDDKKYKFLFTKFPSIISYIIGERSFLSEEKEKQVLAALFDSYFANGGNEKIFFENMTKGRFGRRMKRNFYKNVDPEIVKFIKLKFQE